MSRRALNTRVYIKYTCKTFLPTTKSAHRFHFERGINIQTDRRRAKRVRKRKEKKKVQYFNMACVYNNFFINTRLCEKTNQVFSSVIIIFFFFSIFIKNGWLYEERIYLFNTLVGFTVVKWSSTARSMRLFAMPVTLMNDWHVRAASIRPVERRDRMGNKMIRMSLTP